MMKSLPLFYHPTTWLWIDDDKNLLDNMVLIFQQYNYIKPFISAKECLNFLKDYKLPSSNYVFLKSISQDENYGVLKHTPTDFDVTMLIKIANDPMRHQEISAMIIDYSMPEIDGFKLAKECSHLSIQKILLTGKAQAGDAIIGFNNNLIHRYIQKYEAELATKLINYLQEVTMDYFLKISNPIILHLEAENKLPLTDHIFIEHFKQHCKKNRISEYYLIDKQGSYVCIDGNGQKTCFLVESDYSINSWLSSYGSELSPTELSAINEKSKIPFFGVGKEAWQVDTKEWKNHFYTPEILDGRERYYWSIINL